MTEPGAEPATIVRLANFVGPRSGGLRTALHELGRGYRAAGHNPVLVVPGPRFTDDETPQGRVITLPGPVVPWMGGYRVVLGRRRLGVLLEELRPDRLEVSDRTTLRWTGPWARRHHVPAVMVSHESVAGLLSLPLRSKWPQPPGMPDAGAMARMIQGMARVLADALNARTAQAYAQVVCTTRWAAAEFERLGVRNLRHVPLGRRIHELNQIVDQLAAQFGTLHFDAAEDSQVYDRCMWSVDRLHPSERGHRHIACRFHDQRDSVSCALVRSSSSPTRRRSRHAGSSTGSTARIGSAPCLAVIG